MKADALRGQNEAIESHSKCNRKQLDSILKKMTTPALGAFPLNRGAPIELMPEEK